MPRRQDYAAFLLSMFIFGTNGLLVAVIPLTSAQIVLTRTLFGSLFLGLVLLRRRRLPLAALRADLVPVVISGVCLGANWVFLFEAYRYASVSVGTLLYYCGPMLVLAASPLLFRERLTPRKLAAVAAVAAGMLCLTGSAEAAGLSLRGLLSGAAAALLYASLIVSNKVIRHLDGLSSTLVQLVIGFLVVLCYLLARREFPFALPGGRALAAVLVLGIVNTGLACWLYFGSMQRLPAQAVALCCYLDPVSAVLLSALFLHERMTALQWLGAALILGGALLGALSTAAEKRPSDAVPRQEP